MQLEPLALSNERVGGSPFQSAAQGPNGRKNLASRRSIVQSLRGQRRRETSVPPLIGQMVGGDIDQRAGSVGPDLESRLVLCQASFAAKAAALRRDWSVNATAQHMRKNKPNGLPALIVRRSKKPMTI